MSRTIVAAKCAGHDSRSAWREWLMQLFKRSHLRAILSFAFFLGFVLQSTARAESVRWYSNFDEASTAARESNKPMMMDFWAGWCAACKVMENDVYRDDTFVNAAPQFLTVRIDFDKTQALARKYNVVELPTLIFTDSYGTELFRYRGFIDARALAELMRSLPADVSEFNRLDRILAQDKNNFDALANMGKDLRAAGLYLASNDYYQRALQRSDAKVNASGRESILTQMAMNSLEVKDGKRAAEVLEKCLKEFPNSMNRPEWELELKQAYALSEKKDKARKR
jgi:thioredoxin-like negative regulator of GroEL